MQCVSASRPVAAVTAGGTDKRQQRINERGVGHQMRTDHALFQLDRFHPAGWHWAKLPLPVPAVVGRQTSDSSRPLQEIDAEDFGGALPAARQGGDELGHVHRAAAADAQHGLNVRRLRIRQNLFKQPARRLAIHRPASDDFAPGLLQGRNQETDVRQHGRTADQQHAPDAALRETVRRIAPRSRCRKRCAAVGAG